ncbi:hypothetical protein J6590_027055, partial [Homalodisca vitripennis]
NNEIVTQGSEAAARDSRTSGGMSARMCAECLRNAGECRQQQRTRRHSYLITSKRSIRIYPGSSPVYFQLSFDSAGNLGQKAIPLLVCLCQVGQVINNVCQNVSGATFSCDFSSVDLLIVFSSDNGDTLLLPAVTCVFHRLQSNPYFTHDESIVFSSDNGDTLLLPAVTCVFHRLQSNPYFTHDESIVFSSDNGDTLLLPAVTCVFHRLQSNPYFTHDESIVFSSDNGDTLLLPAVTCVFHRLQSNPYFTHDDSLLFIW